MPDPFRPDPALPVASMKTYGVSRPMPTHTRPATCAEVECAAHVHGWKTEIDEGTEFGRRQAQYIRADRTRFKREGRSERGLTLFVFPPGQNGFGHQHRVPLDRPPHYLVRDGDWRGNPTGRVRQHQSGEEWVEDFAEHQDRLNRDINGS